MDPKFTYKYTNVSTHTDMYIPIDFFILRMINVNWMILIDCKREFWTC